MTSIPRYTIVIKLRQSNLVVKIIKIAFFSHFCSSMGKNKVEDPMNAKTEIVRLISSRLEQRSLPIKVSLCGQRQI